MRVSDQCLEAFKNQIKLQQLLINVYCNHPGKEITGEAWWESLLKIIIVKRW